MRDYSSGQWGFGSVCGLRASVFPKALAVALPNAAIAFLLASAAEASPEDQALAENAFSIWAGFSSVLFFLLSFRSNVAYNRWWEGGTLLQQTRGEWFNAYSSLVAFTSCDPAREAEVEAYHHMLARLMSLLFCSALQQVSPNKDRAFEVIDSYGIDANSLEFLKGSTDRVEVILQWIQRSIILNMNNRVLDVAPPVATRAFQEISRGIVNLQNARKIADFPFPFPTAQTSMVMLLIHWMMCPILASLLLKPILAAVTCFVLIFFFWGVNFIALQLESPFGTGDNDLPMDQMQAEWNKSIATLLSKRAHNPPSWSFDRSIHRLLQTTSSDVSRHRRAIISEQGAIISACASTQGFTSVVPNFLRRLPKEEKASGGRKETVVPPRMRVGELTGNFDAKGNVLFGCPMQEEKSKDACFVGQSLCVSPFPQEASFVSFVGNPSMTPEVSQSILHASAVDQLNSSTSSKLVAATASTASTASVAPVSTTSSAARCAADSKVGDGLSVPRSMSLPCVPTSQRDSTGRSQRDSTGRCLLDNCRILASEEPAIDRNGLAGAAVRGLSSRLSLEAVAGDSLYCSMPGGENRSSRRAASTGSIRSPSVIIYGADPPGLE